MSEIFPWGLRDDDAYKKESATSEGSKVPAVDTELDKKTLPKTAESYAPLLDWLTCSTK